MDTVSIDGHSRLSSGKPIIAQEFSDVFLLPRSHRQVGSSNTHLVGRQCLRGNEEQESLQEGVKGQCGRSNRQKAYFARWFAL